MCPWGYLGISEGYLEDIVRIFCSCIRETKSLSLDSDDDDYEDDDDDDDDDDDVDDDNDCGCAFIQSFLKLVQKLFNNCECCHLSLFSGRGIFFFLQLINLNFRNALNLCLPLSLSLQ